MKILVVKRDKTQFIDESILQYMTGQDMQAGVSYEKGYIIRTDAIMHGVPQYETYNEFMIIANQKGFSSVFFNF